MRIGWNAPGGMLDSVIGEARQAGAEGFTAFSTANSYGHDAIASLAVAGSQTSMIRLLTAVMPTHRLTTSPFPVADGSVERNRAFMAARAKENS